MINMQICQEQAALMTEKRSKRLRLGADVQIGTVVRESVGGGDILVQDQAALRTRVVIVYRGYSEGNGRYAVEPAAWFPTWKLTKAPNNKPLGWRIFGRELRTDFDAMDILLVQASEATLRLRHAATSYDYTTLSGKTIRVSVGESGRVAGIYDYDGGPEIATCYRDHTGLFVVNYGVESKKRHKTLADAIEAVIGNFDQVREMNQSWMQQRSSRLRND